MKINYKTLSYFLIGVVIIGAIFGFYKYISLQGQLNACNQRERNCNSETEKLAASNQQLQYDNKFLRDEEENYEKLFDDMHKVDKQEKTRRKMGYRPDWS